MTQSRLTHAHLDDQGATFTFEGAEREALATELSSFFKGRGYRLENGEPLDGTWGTGSAVLRVILGGLVKRNKFQVRVTEADGALSLALTKAMSGALGGYLGYRRMKTETEALATALKAHFKA